MIETWKQLFDEESEKQYFKDIYSFLKEDSKKYKILPDQKDIYNAFGLTPFDKVSVVIYGQDPYIQIQQPHGLAFSVRKDIATPPSLKNIYKEIKNDLNIDIPKTGNLESWAQQGVLLLNSILTVREGQSGSHKEIGWQILTDKVISCLNEKQTPLVFILWGAFARSKKKLITNDKHLVLEGSHPSPLSAHSGFFGGKYFSKCNQFLEKNNITPINWSII
jgi:uracil-DNA glycosylase